ncbi:MAG: DUF1761 domain-containing protein [Bacteroidia bacterium]|nr:DUF1761 domain-containing protein [Bacteroidia bacterium]
MPEINLTAVILGGLMPLLIGYIWYHPKVFGDILSIINHGEIIKKPHPPLVYFVTFILSVLITMLIAAILSTHAIEDQTAAHGAFHGLMASIFMGIPTFAIIAMFESKSVKYILIHAFYWMICFALMGFIVGLL